MFGKNTYQKIYYLYQEKFSKKNTWKKKENEKKDRNVIIWK